MILLLAYGAATPQHAFASQGCDYTNPPLSHSFDGANNTDSNTYAVGGSITTHNPSLCSETNGAPPSGSDSSAWTLIRPTCDTTGNAYAQSGYVNDATDPTIGTGLKFFAEYRRDNNTPYVGDYTIGSVSGGTTHSYDTFYNFTNGYFELQIDGTTYSTTNFDPIATSSWMCNWGAQWSGETFNKGDDMPGSSTNTTVFSGLWVRTCRSCGNVAPTGISLFTQGPAMSHYNQSKSSNTQFSIWTN